MESSAEKQFVAKINTFADVLALLSKPQCDIEAQFTSAPLPKSIVLILKGFLIIIEEFKSPAVDNGNYEIAPKWLQLFVRMQRTHTSLSQKVPLALTYMIGLVDQIPKDRSSVLIKILVLMQKSINLANKMCFEKFRDYTGCVAILWTALKSVTCFETQIEILQVFRLILIRLDIDFVISEVYSQSSRDASVFKASLTALKSTEYNDDCFNELTRQILNQLNAFEGSGSLVRSFYCDGITLGEKWHFTAANNSQILWFNINTCPRTITFYGRFQPLENTKRQSVNISLKIKSFVRQNNKLKVFLVSPPHFFNITKPFSLDKEFKYIDVATMMLSESEMQRFVQVFKVQELPLTKPPSLVHESANDGNKDFTEKLKFFSSLNLKPKKEATKKEEFKMPSLELYQKALAVGKKATKMLSKTKKLQQQHHFKTIPIAEIAKTSYKIKGANRTQASFPIANSPRSKMTVPLSLNAITTTNTTGGQSLSLPKENQRAGHAEIISHSLSHSKCSANAVLAEITSKPQKSQKSVAADDKIDKKILSSDKKSGAAINQGTNVPIGDKCAKKVVAKKAKKAKPDSYAVPKAQQLLETRLVASSSQHSSKNEQQKDDSANKEHQATISKKQTNSLVITPTLPTEKNKFFKNPRQPKTYSMPWESSFFKGEEKSVKLHVGKKVQEVQPLHFKAAVNEFKNRAITDQPAATIAIQATENATLQFNAGYDVENSTTQIEGQGFSRLTALPSELEYLVKQEDEIGNIVKPPLPAQFMKQSLPNERDSSSEFSDTVSPVPLDEIINQLESSTASDSDETKQKFARVEFQFMKPINQRTEHQKQITNSKSQAADADHNKKIQDTTNAPYEVSCRRNVDKRSYNESSSDPDFEPVNKPKKKRLRKPLKKTA